MILTRYILITLLTLLSLEASAVSSAFMPANIYHQECKDIKKFIIKDQMAVLCRPNFHQYNVDLNSDVYNSVPIPKDIKIASFNMWHPGQQKTIFKDYGLMAKMLNQWDFVAAQELQAVVSNDRDNNESVVKFIQQAPNDIEKLKLRLNSTSSESERESLKLRIKKLKGDLTKAPKLFRAPGYLKLLLELRKLDPTWALIISSDGEAARETNVQEFVGYFYRSSIIRPMQSLYCAEYRPNTSDQFYACTVPFDGVLLEQSYAEFFSRRPFLGRFQSGKNTFTFASSHIVYNSPRDPVKKRKFLQTLFGVDSVEQIGEGAYPNNYARLGELKLILKFLNAFKQRYPQEQIIFGGDFNLDSSNPYVQRLLLTEGLNRWDMQVTTPTTTKYGRYSHGEPTWGLANNYDHFLVSKQNNNCTQAHSYNFFRDPFMKKRIERKYKIRIEKKNAQGYYMVSEARKRKGRKLFASFKKSWTSRYTIKNNEVVQDPYKLQKTVLDFKRRVLDSQLKDSSYWRYMIEVLSDHLPIQLSCQTKL